ncbi:thioredoxin 2 [Alcaligenes faecalis subsp. faecalis NCIB 8687]|jgi:thioredoxin 2|nr:thioredoxin 2 [Alcaligenes faecalis subsp. faecalis NCIB 8687]
MFNEAAEHHQPLFYCGGSPMSIVELNEETFQAAVEDGKPLIIDFWAPWCGPCRQFAPVFDAAAAKHPDVTFAKVNTEEEQELAAGLRIRSIPTLMVFRERVLLFSQAGALSAAQLDDLVEQVKAVDMEKVHAEIAAQQNQEPDQA